MLVDSLTQHYQNTYEQTYQFWLQRNRTFLFLLAVIGLAALMMFGSPGTDSMAVFIIAKFVGIHDAAGRTEIQQGFSFSLIQSVFLILIFYLMVNLHHRSHYVLRNYQYLGKLEVEIRRALELDNNSVAFSRESSFYWDHRNWGNAAVKWVYIIMLGALLATFLGGKLYSDLNLHRYWLFSAELFIAGAIMLFYAAYALASIKLDRRDDA